MNATLSVIDKNGEHGTIDAAAPPPFDGSGDRVIVRFDGDRPVIVPVAALVPRKEQGFFLSDAVEDFQTYQSEMPVPETAQTEYRQSNYQTSDADILELDEPAPRTAAYHQSAIAAGDSFAANQTVAHAVDQPTETLVFPVIAEALEIERRRIETARVRITKRITEREEVVTEPAIQETVNVERVSINRLVEAPPPIRYQGETMIVPLVEEVVVTEKRLVLKEELHITKHRETVPTEPQRIVLRSEEAIVERVPLDGSSLDSNDAGR